MRSRSQKQDRKQQQIVRGVLATANCDLFSWFFWNTYCSMRTVILTLTLRIQNKQNVDVFYTASNKIDRFKSGGHSTVDNRQTS